LQKGENEKEGGVDGDEVHVVAARLARQSGSNSLQSSHQPMSAKIMKSTTAGDETYAATKAVAQPAA